MIQIEKPDYYIRIGLSDDKIVSIDWDSFVINPGFIQAIQWDDKIIKQRICYHLKNAIKFMF